MDTAKVKEHIQNLVEKFERDKHHYLSKGYLEAQTRKDFIDPFFERSFLPPRFNLFWIVQHNGENVA